MMSRLQANSLSTANIPMAATRTAAQSLLHRVQSDLSSSSIEFVYLPYDRWPIPRHPLRRPLNISVLDASFNPPTLAHLALVNTRRPTYTPFSNPERRPPAEEDTLDYDAKLLLLSVRNADKYLQPGDASYFQRLEMMALLAQDVNSNEGKSDGEPNVAVAVIDEPTFVEKSDRLQNFFRNRFAEFASESPQHPIYDAQLTFLLGLDTLERLVQPRYYASQSEMIAALRKFLSPAPDGDDSRIVCARRTSSNGGGSSVPQNANLAIAQEFISSERIVLIDIDENVRAYSSSEVRKTIAHLGLEAKDWRSLVSGRIAEYIANERLYIGQA